MSRQKFASTIKVGKSICRHSSEAVWISISTSTRTMMKCSFTTTTFGGTLFNMPREAPPAVSNHTSGSDGRIHRYILIKMAGRSNTRHPRGLRQSSIFLNISGSDSFPKLTSRLSSFRRGRRRQRRPASTALLLSVFKEFTISGMPRLG